MSAWVTTRQSPGADEHEVDASPCVPTRFPGVPLKVTIAGFTQRVCVAAQRHDTVITHLACNRAAHGGSTEHC